jgi:crotonobetainyl-CoA:carnitine CoA-transferase CaiB-like acyl-CoA transferase
MGGEMPGRGPLAGIKVVDLTQILAGPFCTQLMADAGADVIKVEPPGGDLSRVRGSWRARPDGSQSISGFSAVVNRNKRSVVVDLKTPQGQEIVRRLAASADVLIENFAPGTVDRLGLNLSALRASNSRLITVSINLWGVPASDELAHRGGLALIAEAESGVMDQSRSDNDVPFVQSIRVPIADLASGISAYASITTAFLERLRTGIGRHIDVSLVRTMLTLNSVALVAAQMPAAPWTTAAMGVFPTKDGLICIGVNSDRLWARLAKCMGRPELADDPQYRSYRERDVRAAEVNSLIAEWTSRHSSADLMKLMGPTGLPVGAVMSADDLLGAASADRLGWWADVPDGIGGSVRVPNGPLPWHRDHEAVTPLNADAGAVLGEMGIDNGEFKRLAAEGVFGALGAGNE